MNTLKRDAKTVKYFAEKYDEAVHYNEENKPCYVEDWDGYDYYIKELKVEKTKVTITASHFNSKTGMSIQEVTDALACAGAKLPLFVILPGKKKNYWVDQIGHGCSNFYMSPE